MRGFSVENDKATPEDWIAEETKPDTEASKL
jgi:hypothetical protein